MPPTTGHLTFFNVPKLVQFSNSLPFNTSTMTDFNQSLPLAVTPPITQEGDNTSNERTDNAAGETLTSKNKHRMEEENLIDDGTVLEEEEDEEEDDKDGRETIMSYEDDDEDHIEVDKNGQPIPPPISPPWLANQATRNRTAPEHLDTKQAAMSSLKDRLLATTMRMHKVVPANMRSAGGAGTATAAATATAPADDGWADVVKKSKTKAYTEAPVAMGATSSL
jgi:hypothetical protein